MLKVKMEPLLHFDRNKFLLIFKLIFFITSYSCLSYTQLGYYPTHQKDILPHQLLFLDCKNSLNYPDFGYY